MGLLCRPVAAAAEMESGTRAETMSGAPRLETWRLGGRIEDPLELETRWVTWWK